LDPGNASGYVLLSNIYAAADKWDGFEGKLFNNREEGQQCEETAWLHMDWS
jgi:hypothetical protein